MSQFIVSRVYQYVREEIAPGQLNVLVFLAFHADEEGVAQITVQALARGCRMTPRAATADLRGLVAAGDVYHIVRPGQPSWLIVLTGDPNAGTTLRTLLMDRFGNDESKAGEAVARFIAGRGNDAETE